MTIIVDTPPVSDRRKLLEALIRVLDIVIYAAVLASGLFAWLFTPPSVLEALSGWNWLIPVWVFLLVGGGLIGLVGRLSRVWAIEVVGTPTAVAGAAIYLVVLTGLTFTSTTALVAVALVVGVVATLIRRYVELQIFTSQPGDGTLVSRVREILRRRTPNSTDRHR